MRIHLVRHGQTDANRENRYCGRTDVPLNDEGRAQARRLRPLLEGRSFEAVYASPLSRTVETARLLVGDAPLRFDETLLEHDFGEYEDLTLKQIRALSPASADEIVRNWPGFVFPGGEASVDVYARAARFASRVVAEHAGDILVVAHLGPLVGIAASLIGLSAPHMWRLRIDNATLSRIVIGRDGYAYLDLLNAVPSPAGV